MGQSKELTILDGNDTNNLFNVSLDAPTSLIDITIQNGNSTSGAAIYLENQNHSFSNKKLHY